MGFFPSLLFAGRVDFCECSSCSVSDPGWTWSLLQEVKAEGREVRSVCTPGGEGGAGSQVCAWQERMWCSLGGRVWGSLSVQVPGGVHGALAGQFADLPGLLLMQLAEQEVDSPA